MARHLGNKLLFLAKNILSFTLRHYIIFIHSYMVFAGNFVHLKGMIYYFN